MRRLEHKLSLLTAATRYPARRLGWFGLDRAARAAARLAPPRALELALARPGAAILDAGLLAAWGAVPGIAQLGPRWAPAEHGDPRRGVFRLVGAEREYAEAPPFDRPGVSPLWDEQLSWLHSTWALVGTCQGPAVRRWLAGWIHRFVERTRPGQIALRPFPTATRILHGARSLALLHAGGHGGDPAAEALERLLWRDGAWLRWRVEHHNAANHLLREQVALLLWAELFGLRRQATLCRRAVARSLTRQFGPAGGHVEQSASYQAQTARDLLELVAALATADRPRPTGLRETTGRALGLLGWLAVEDGVHLFGDGDARTDPGPDALFEVAEALGLPTARPAGELHSAVFGLSGLQRQGSRLLLRAGSVPRLTSAHVHADQLAISWSIDGRRVLGARGTAAYSGPDRDATRSAAWQSTVAVPGRSTARFGGPFRLVASGHGQRLPSEPGSLAGRATDAQDRPLHHRVARLDGARLIVEDLVSGPGAAAARALFHFPEGVARPMGPGGLEVVVPAGRFVVNAGGSAVSASASSWYPTIGARSLACTVAVRLEPGGDGSGARTTIDRLP